MSNNVQTKVEPYVLNEATANSFIFTIDGALPPSICEEMMARFEAHPEDQYLGRIGQDAHSDRGIKKSTDLVVSNKEHWKDVDQYLFRSLALALKVFQEKYPYFKGPFKDSGYAIQRTNPGEHYHWHIDGGSHDFAQRQLVAVWYLNDVPGPGGETEFLFQDVKVKPKQGRLVLFPPFWTHEHRGVTLEKGVKYIATTWVIFA